MSNTMYSLPLFSQGLGYNELESGKINTAVTIGLLAACLVSGQISDMVARRMSNKGRARILAFFLLLGNKKLRAKQD